jgi:type III pantothenate kinase
VNLVIDIGNARIKWAGVENGQLRTIGHVLHVGDFDAAFEKLAAQLPRNVERVVVANVAGERFAKRVAELTRVRFGAQPEFVAVTSERFDVRCGYANPARLGVDRWVAIIAAYHRSKDAACVIGAGTAVTFDAIDASGAHLGGLIFAGARLVAAALDRSTSNIGATSLAGTPPVGLELLGKNTDSAVGHAAMLGVAAALDRAVARVANELKITPRVLVTGGDGPHLRAWLETETQLAADLVLEGLALFADEPAQR